MSKPVSNAPASMQPWVDATDGQLKQIESDVSRLQSAIGKPIVGVDYTQNAGSSAAFTYGTTQDGSTSVGLSNASFVTDAVANENFAVNKTLFVGAAERVEKIYDPGIGLNVEVPIYQPSVAIIGAQAYSNEVTKDTEFTPGSILMNDITFGVNDIHGLVNAAGLVVNMKDLKNSWYSPQASQSLSVTGNGSTAEIRITDTADNLSTYIAGRYMAILDAGVYSSPRTIILSAVDDSANAELVLTFSSTYTDTVNTELASVQINPGYDIIPNSITVQGVEPEYNFAIHNQAGFHVGAGFAGAEPTQAEATTHVYAESVSTPQLLVGGGYGNTGLTVFNSGSIGTNGNVTLDGNLIVGGQTFLPANALSLSNGTGSIQIGSNTQANMAFDNNDIQCRTSGAGSDMFLNRLGGDVYIGNSTRGLGIDGGLVWANGVYGNALTTSYRSMYVSSTDVYDKLGYVASSRDEKKNIEPLSYTAEQILSVEPVQYHYNTEDDASPKHAGMIAEDLHDAGLHGYVSYDKDGKPATINYEFYVSALQQVVRHQAEQIASLSARLDALEAK